jgi:hypothetical protein
MATEANEVRAAEPERFAFQFGLSTLLMLTVLVAVSCSLFFSMPNKPATIVLILISLALPAVFATVLIYGQGYRRTFCLGALFPSGVMMVCSSLMIMIHAISAYQNNVDIWVQFADKVGPYYRPFVGTAWVASILIGLLCVLVRLLTERSNRTAERYRRQ